MSRYLTDRCVAVFRTWRESSELLAHASSVGEGALAPEGSGDSLPCQELSCVNIGVTLTAAPEKDGEEWEWMRVTEDAEQGGWGRKTSEQGRERTSSRSRRTPSKDPSEAQQG